MKKAIKIIKKAVLIYLLFFIICVAAVPALQKKMSSESQTELAVEMAQPKASGERVRSIDGNEDALLWRLRLIESAKEELVFTTFDLDDDESGMEVMAALAHAARRGVHVRIAVDGIRGLLNLRSSACFQELCSMEDVEAKEYNSVSLLKPWKLNYRMHDKYILVDGQMYLLGGRNTNNLFLGNYRKRYNIDRDILVYETMEEENSSMDQLSDYFEAIWELKDCRPLAGKSSQEAAEKLKECYEELKSKYPEAFQKTDWEAETMAAESVTLLKNPIQAGNKEPRLWYALNQLMEKGKDILIETPYIICNRAMYEDVEALCEGGRNVQIMTNAVEQGANPFGCTDYLNQKNRILETGAEVYEVLYGQSVHTKTVLIDENISVVGSFNMDMRSVYLDTELMLVIDCPQLNKQLRELAEEQMDVSKHVAEDQPDALGERYTPVEMSTKQKIRYGILRVVTYPFRHLL